MARRQKDRSTHLHEPTKKKIESKIPDHVFRFIALEEALAHKRVITIEDTRLKKDEFTAKGLMEGFPYYRQRFIGFREVLLDKQILTKDNIRHKMNDLKRKYNKQGLKIDPNELETKAVVDLILEKEILTIHEFGRKYVQVRNRNPMTGGRIIARAWSDPDFKNRLLVDAKSAIMSLDPSLIAPSTGETVDTWIQVFENTEKVRSVVVCTLCSCYPRGLLGEPPEWYTSDAYKKRIVREPKKVLKEMGLKLNDDVAVRVFDSTADIRYMVIPIRPKGTENLSEEELAKLVTRDNLIGVSDPLSAIHQKHR